MAPSSSPPACSIEDRREEISTEHNVTCERINLNREEQRKFLLENLAEPPGHHDQWETFTEWLQDDSQLVYWIAGQPRSGKSTLMRFLHDDKVIQNRVQMWADGSRLVKVPFFLRQPTSYWQLLGQLLDQAMDGRDLFPDLLPSGNTRQPQEVLESAFGEMVSGDQKNVAGLQEKVPGNRGKFLFMIDGVEHLGKDAQALSNLLELYKSAGQSVKVCVSGSYGCPLGQTFTPSVRMEILSKVDIWRNISNELDNSRRFYLLRNNRPERSQQIIRHIVNVADGSFLYARLATAWYFGELVEREIITDMHLQIPPSSEEIIENLLRHSYPSGLSTSRLFGLIQQAEHTEEPLSLDVLSFVMELDSHNIGPGIQAATRSEIDERAHTINRCLFYRTGGLLEAPDFADIGARAKVRYHETAKEWKDQLWELVHKQSGDLGLEKVNRMLCTELCLAYLRRIKTLDPKQPTFFASFRSLATACLKYSFMIEQTPGGSGQKDYINKDIILALDQDAEQLLKERQPPSDRSFMVSHCKEPPLWSVKVQGHSNSYSTIGPHWTNVCDIVNYQPPSSLFDFALQHNLCSVVEKRLAGFNDRATGNGNGNINGNTGHGAEKPQQNGPKRKTWEQKKKEKRGKDKAAKNKREQLKKQGLNPDLEEEETDPVHKLVGGRILPLTLIARSQHSRANPAPISVRMAEILLENGADPDYEESSEAPGGNTAWHALLKAMASEMPKPKPPPKKTSTTESRPSTAENTPNENRVSTEGKLPTKEELQGKIELLKAKRSKALADLDRRCRLTTLAIMFLEHDADSYATVRAMPPPPEPEKKDESGGKPTQETTSFITRLAKKVDELVKKDADAAVTAMGNVPKWLGKVNTLRKETWALTRDIDSAKLTLDQIVESVQKVDEDTRKDLEANETDIEAARKDLLERFGETPSTEEVGNIDKANWQKVDDAIKRRREAEKATNWDVLRGRAWAQVKLFAR